jgi:RNA polymerase sigma-70 factor (ECF subfamily)
MLMEWDGTGGRSRRARRIPAVPDAVLPRIAAGDQSAVSECLARYGGLVWALARRFLANLSDAEDAVQEIFVDLWRNAPRFDPNVASEATFVTLLARRRLIDRRRRDTRRLDGSQALPLPDSLAAAGGDGAARAELADEAAHAAGALARLREEPRRCLQLAIYHGLTHDEISRATGLPLGTVKTHVRRGLLRVRELLCRSTPPAARPAETPKPRTPAHPEAPGGGPS